MAHLSKPECVMKRILILLLALMPVIVSAQDVNRIISDTSEEGVRSVIADSYATITDDMFIHSRYAYMKNSEAESYYITMICQYDSNPWYVKAGSAMKFEMMDDTAVYIKAALDGTPTRTGSGYQTSVSCFIPMDKYAEFLKGVKRVTFATNMLRDDSPSRVQFMYSFNTMSNMMDAYLQLLMKTGR